MKKRYFPIRIGFVLFLSLVLLTQVFATSVSANSSTGTNANGATITIRVDMTSPVTISNINPGMSTVDNSLSYPWGTNDINAVNNAKTLMSNSLSFMNVFTQAWGAPDIWPDPNVSDPANWNWSLLDAQLKIVLDIGATPVISLATAPWWMKGQLQKDGTTRLIPDARGENTRYTYPTAFTDYRGITYPAGYVSPDPYNCRILDNQMDNWTRLVQEIAKRYMAAPYNVRYFQVWNELKGYYNSAQNRWSYENNPGDPSGYNAKNGYTYMYNRVYTAIMSEADFQDIPSNDIKIGGPYVVMVTWSTTTAGGFATKEAALKMKKYGTYDQRSLDVVKYWLQNKVGAGFITLDGKSANFDNKELTDPFTASEKFADVTNWVRSLDNDVYPGAQTLPIWWAEYHVSSIALDYTTPRTGSTLIYDNAIKSYALAKLINAGASVTLAWGTSEFFTPTNTVRGGQALPWTNINKVFKASFSSGTQLYKTTVSDPTKIEAISTLSKTLVINKTNSIQQVSVNGTRISLDPWGVKVVEIPAQMQEITIHKAG
jgi:hypothetical protein